MVHLGRSIITSLFNLFETTQEFIQVSIWAINETLQSLIWAQIHPIPNLWHSGVHGQTVLVIWLAVNRASRHRNCLAGQDLPTRFWGEPGPEPPKQKIISKGMPEFSVRFSGIYSIFNTREMTRSRLQCPYIDMIQGKVVICCIRLRSRTHL